MKTDLRYLTVAELAECCEDIAEGGVRGYVGRLNIRLAFRREHVPDAQYSAILLGVS